MKTLIVSILLLSTAALTAVNAQYVSKMNETLESMDQCQTLEDYQKVANTFEIIAAAEQDKWLPHYYCSLIYGMMSMQATDSDQKDLYADKSQSAIKSGLAISPDESEFYVLKAFAYYASIQVDPMTRGMEYMGLADGALAKAEELNPDNPRIYFLRGQAAYNMPVEFGGGAQAALPILKTAKEKYDNEDIKDELQPKWGREDINQMLEQIATGEE